MRKEVKLGFAIGGVVLAVLFVYVLVISSGPPQKKNVSLATPELSPASPEQSSPSNPTDAATGAKSDSDSTAANNPANPPASDPASAAPGGAPSPADPNSDRWAKALQTGKLDPEKLPLMLTETPVDRSTPPVASPGATAVPGVTATPGASTPGAPVPSDQTASAATTDPPTIAAQVLGSAPTTLPAGASPALTSGARTHVVQRGESFSTIAAAVYGSESYYPHLLRANPGIEPKKLRPGMTINIPDPAQVVMVTSPGGVLGAESQSSIGTSGATVSTLANPVDEKTEYRVRTGDSLYKVSIRLYGKSDRVDKLYELNKNVIGPDPAHLKTGMLLKLPEPPTITASAR